MKNKRLTMKRFLWSTLSTKGRHINPKYNDNILVLISINTSQNI